MARVRSVRRAPSAPMVRAIAWTAGGLVLVLLVLGVLAGRRLLQVSADLRDAKRSLDLVGTQVEDGALADARAGLVQAQGLVAKANSALYQSPEIDLIS